MQVVTFIHLLCMAVSHSFILQPSVTPYSLETRVPTPAKALPRVFIPWRQFIVEMEAAKLMHQMADSKDYAVLGVKRQYEGTYHDMLKKQDRYDHKFQNTDDFKYYQWVADNMKRGLVK